MDNKHVFDRRALNAIAADMRDILFNTHVEHIPVVSSAFIRLLNGMMMRSSNIQKGRFMEMAGLTDASDPHLTKKH
jgi:hypothetical protein